MILETIVTTMSADGAVHIAPFGITQEESGPVIAPFRPSTTLDNLEATGCAVINLTDDVRVFAGCLTGKRDWPTRPATVVPGRVLEGALAHVEVRVASREDDPARPRFRLSVVHEETHAPFRGFNRAQAAVVEAAILVSRLHMLPPEKIEREIAYLEIAVDKTAGPREREAWGWLMERIADYKAGAKAAG
ncbi:MAG TPA: DUF447 domain-containing protein [Alphaproteobacteria bacterium]|jgi:hypothetical protein|nr:DUF447 domain-containing protein [Alphaproteobacteria bacterium]